MLLATSGFLLLSWNGIDISSNLLVKISCYAIELPCIKVCKNSRQKICILVIQLCLLNNARTNYRHHITDLGLCSSAPIVCSAGNGWVSGWVEPCIVCIFMIKITFSSGYLREGMVHPGRHRKWATTMLIYIYNVYVSRFAIELKIPGVNKHDLC